MRIQFIILSIVMTALFMACSKKNIETPKSNARVASMTGKWALTHVGEKVTNFKSIDNAAYIYIETNDKSIRGYTGCNTLRGSIENLSGSNVKFSTIGATKRMCNDPKSESAFLNAFDNITHYGTDRNELYFLDSSGAKLLSFKKIITSQEVLYFK